MTKAPHDRILVLDHAPAVRELLRELLEMSGYRVTAPASLPEEPQEVGRQQPALVILDHYLGTESEGWQFLRRLPADPTTRPIPILICTTAVTEVWAREGDLAALGVGVVRKPFDLDELLGAVSRALEPNRTGHLAGSVGSQDLQHPPSIIVKGATADRVLPGATVAS